MQDHRGVVTQEDGEEVGSITCKSGGERVQVGVPDNEMCSVLCEGLCVSREPKGTPGILRSQTESITYTGRGQLGHGRIQL